MKDLKDKFNELKNEYHNSKTTEQRRTELLQEMKSCLIKINNNNDRYEFQMDYLAGMVTQISQCTNPSQLYDILGDLKAGCSSGRLTEIAEQSREMQMKQNKYNKNNPYPNK